MPRFSARLADTDRQVLEQMVASGDRFNTLRARIVLLADEGKTDAVIAYQMRVSRKTVWRWRTRFAKMGVAGIQRTKPRSGRKPTVRNAWAGKIIETTLSVRPQDGVRWTTRRLAEVLGISRGMVHRVWREYGITPPNYAHPSQDAEPISSQVLRTA
jgi:transposase